MTRICRNDGWTVMTRKKIKEKRIENEHIYIHTEIERKRIVQQQINQNRDREKKR